MLVVLYACVGCDMCVCSRFATGRGVEEASLIYSAHFTCTFLFTNAITSGRAI